MAQQALVIDASVGVKWFSDKGETALQAALAIRGAHLSGRLQLIVPDLFFYEVSNAIIYKQSIPTRAALSAATALSELGLHTVPVDTELLQNSVKLSRQFNITIYDSCYLAVAQKYECPLVTANPRHQQPAAGCRVIPLEKWKD